MLNLKCIFPFIVKAVPTDIVSIRTHEIKGHCLIFLVFFFFLKYQALNILQLSFLNELHEKISTVPSVESVIGCTLLCGQNETLFNQLLLDFLDI